MTKLVFLFLSNVIILGSSNKHESRIVGGMLARAGQFPFAAAIYSTTSTGTYFCGGALLNTEWVLTAAHCVDDAVLFNIRLGVSDLESATALRLSTSTYFIHPDYSSQSLDNNIALIKFRMSITLTDYIQPIQLSDVAFEAGTTVIALGWGQWNDMHSELSDYLNYVHLVSLTNEECRITFGSQITDNMVCVAGDYNQGTCLGDLGGPLMHYDEKHLVGIASFISGNGCETTDPSGFTRINPYIGWITNIINNN